MWHRHQDPGPTGRAPLRVGDAAPTRSNPAESSTDEEADESHVSNAVHVSNSEPQQHEPRDNPSVVRLAYSAELLTQAPNLAENEFLKGIVVRRKGLFSGASYDFFLACQAGGSEYRAHCYTATLKGGSAEVKPVDEGAHPQGYMTERSSRFSPGDKFLVNGQDRLSVRWINGLKNNEQCDVEMDANGMALVNRKAKQRDARDPSWNLWFGRDAGALAQKASCKNLQMRPKDAPDSLASARFVLGKMEDHFAVHFRQPFSSVEAFGLALIIFAESSK